MADKKKFLPREKEQQILLGTPDRANASQISCFAQYPDKLAIGEELANCYCGTLHNTRQMKTPGKRNAFVRGHIIRCRWQRGPPLLKLWIAKARLFASLNSKVGNCAFWDAFALRYPATLLAHCLPTSYPC